jgi:hypothetical protein
MIAVEAIGRIANVLIFWTLVLGGSGLSSRLLAPLNG